VFRYRSLDPLAWLDGHDDGRSNGTDGTRTTVVFREEESEAAYLSGTAPVLTDAVNLLAARHPEWMFVGVPRYSPERLRQRLQGANVTVLTQAVDSAALLARADLFLGGGGTMNIEAAFFGTPAVCCRPLTCAYETWLIERKLAFKPPELTVAAVVRMAELLQGRRVDAALLRQMRFPVQDLLDEIERIAVAGSSRTPAHADPVLNFSD
jgi:predicted glycosyltransferase